MSLARLLPGLLLLERYAVEGVLGHGAMGIVFRGTDQRLRRAVALKVLTNSSGDAADRGRARARFQREAIATARLDHPNAVRIYDYGTDAALDLDVLVMELLEGQDLAAWMERPELSAPVDAIDLIRQAARGLGAGHRKGLVHRDVKPSNLFASPADTGVRVRVLDFGIVEMFDPAETQTRLTTAGLTPHTPRYASPEQLRGETSLTPATDVYSLGLAATELLLGERVFGDATLKERASAASRVVPRMRDHDVPPDVIAAVARAIAFEPVDRFENADLFADALDVVGDATIVPHLVPASSPYSPTLDAMPATPKRVEVADSDEASTRAARRRLGRPALLTAAGQLSAHPCLSGAIP